MLTKLSVFQVQNCLRTDFFFFYLTILRLHLGFCFLDAIMQQYSAAATQRRWYILY